MDENEPIYTPLMTQSIDNDNHFLCLHTGRQRAINTLLRTNLSLALI